MDTQDSFTLLDIQAEFTLGSGKKVYSSRVHFACKLPGWRSLVIEESRGFPGHIFVKILLDVVLRQQRYYLTCSQDNKDNTLLGLKIARYYFTWTKDSKVITWTKDSKDFTWAEDSRDITLPELKIAMIYFCTWTEDSKGITLFGQDRKDDILCGLKVARYYFTCTQQSEGITLHGLQIAKVLLYVDLRQPRNNLRTLSVLSTT